MKIYIILKCEYCEWSAEYGSAEPVEIKFRKAHAEDAVSALNEANPSERYYYEEMNLSLSSIPWITNGQMQTLIDVDLFNQGEQLNELIIMERIREIAELKEEVKKLKQSVAYEKTRASRAESIRSKTEQELRTVRNTIRAAKKIDKPKFLGFEDSDGVMYPIDSENKNCVLVGLNRDYSIPISELRKRKGELKPLYEARPAQ